MTLRHTHKMGLSLFNRVWGGSIFVNNNIDVRFLTSLVIFCVSSNTSKFYREFRNCSGVPLASEHSSKIDGRTLSTAHKAKSSRYTPQANMGSILNHDKYSAIKSNLSKMTKGNFSLGSLDSAALWILSSKDLTVNLDILRLDALSPSSHQVQSCKGYAEIKEMIRCGEVKQGKFNKEDEAAIEKKFETLLAETGLDREELMEELFATNKGSRMLKRQLVGFYLLKDMKDGDRRLPMEVLTKLAVLLYSGSFTKEEDAIILAWVDKHGATRWAELAGILDRRYLGAGQSVQTRYVELMGKAKGNRQGAYGSEEFRVLIKEVMEQDAAAFEKPMEYNDLDFKRIALHMGRPRAGIWNFYARLVHPTVRRHKLGTLEKDVREDLIRQVKENGWKLSADIEYDKLARLTQFEGHSSISLYFMYQNMLLRAMIKVGKNSRREVAVDEVEEWWNKSTRFGKRASVVEKEQQIVEAYYRIKQELKV